MFSVNECILPDTVKDPPSCNSNSPDPFKMLILNLTVPTNNIPLIKNNICLDFEYIYPRRSGQ